MSTNYMSTSYKKILVAVDFDHEPVSVLNRALQIAKKEGATVKLVHVVSPIDDIYINTYGAVGFPGVGNADEFREQVLKVANDKLNELADGRSIELEVLYGHTVNEIVVAANEYQADLVVLGSHGKHGLKLLLGSTSSGVLHHASCDTLMVRLG